MKRTTRLLMMLAVLLMTAVQASAENVWFNVCSWDDTNKKVVTKTEVRDCIVLEGQNVEWQGLGAMGQETWYVVKGKAQRKALNIFGTVHLVLADQSEMNCQHIKLEYRNGAKLHVHSVPNPSLQGEIYVQTYMFSDRYRKAAGIGGGGGEGSDMGSLYVHGGKIAVDNIGWRSSGAGIGGGKESGIHPEAEMVVYDGNVETYGSSFGAGIGGGEYANQGGAVIIYGGTVTAVGTEYGAGIGGGDGISSEYGNGGVVKIYGGIVKARGYKDGYRYGFCYAAGIGGGRCGMGGEVYIYGGQVEARGGGKGAGIGGVNDRWGGICEISGGNVVAKGGYCDDLSAPAIGGGRTGNGGKVKITGGTVRVWKAPTGKGTAALIGGGGNHSDGSLDIAPGLQLHYSTINDLSYFLNLREHGTVLETDASKRYEKCVVRDYTYAKISPCNHEGTGATYKQVDEHQHSVVCKTCGYEGKENHTYIDGKCVCGREVDKKEPETWTITIHKTTDGKTYTKVEEKVVKGQEYMLPVPEPKDGLLFMGYLQDTSADGIEMKDSEFGSLRDGGEVVNPNNDLTYYARYRYDYTAEWTWNDECTTASVKISSAILNDAQTLTATITEDTEERVEPTMTSPGEYHYNAVATLNRGTGISYQFSDNKSRVVFADVNPKLTLDVQSKDSLNSKTLEEYYGMKADVTINNLTLKKDNKVHPICLPFYVSKNGNTPFKGAIIYELSGTQLKNHEFAMTFTKAEGVKPGIPCFYRFEETGADVQNPVFENVMIDELSGSVAEKQYTSTMWSADDVTLELWGTFEPETIDEESRELYFVMDGDDISLKPETLTAFGGYFYIACPTDEQGNRKVRNVWLGFETDDAYRFSKKLFYSWDGNGSEATPYIIYTAEQLNEMAAAINGGDTDVAGKYFRQGSNITFEKSIENNYTPVKDFNGNYDGAGYVISGLNVNLEAPRDAALFGTLEGNATIKNVIVKNSAFKGSGTGVVARSVFGNASVENCHVLKDVTVESDTNAGGIVGAINGEGAKVTGCTSQATVKGLSGVGGIAGILTTGWVGNSIALGSSVTGSTNVSAVVYRRGGTVENCYFTAPTLSDANAKLMPDVAEDNTNFLEQLHERDQFLQEDNCGLKEEEISYDLTLNGREYKAVKNNDDTWSRRAFTLSLPFDMALTEEQQENIIVYKLHEIDTDKKTFVFTNDFPILKAGEPYILVISKGSLTFQAKNVLAKPVPMEPQIVKNPDGSKELGYWCATFKKLENEELVEHKAYIMQRNGTFRHIDKVYNSKPHVAQFLAYFSAMEPIGTSFKMRFVKSENGEIGEETDFPADLFDSDYDLDDETGIQAIDNGQLTMDNEGTYDLQGRKLSGKPTAKGMYIKGGKKMIVK